MVIEWAAARHKGVHEANFNDILLDWMKRNGTPRAGVESPGWIGASHCRRERELFKPGAMIQSIVSVV